jgi:hypothetical protein
VHFIKMDVEGAEKLVLEGAELILSRDRPIILSEINGDCLRWTSDISSADYVRYFDTIDYEVRSILPGGRCGDRIFDSDPALSEPLLNVACVPAERVAELVAGQR